ncbi:hypothetical protein [Arthrobacter sp. TB 23]|uniref:hypothetical protein n=1 Tax=Arthrobacter sp. TB 23 TaxID=494419 RepID=UPI0002FA76F1|nr:hypothetical protein [Arthrobacter sp. TB 23]
MSRSRGPARIAAAGVLLLSVALAASGCTGVEIGDRPAQSATPSSDPSSAAPATTPPAPKPTVADRPAPDDDWQVFTDPQALVSFELPPDWTAEPIEDPGEGFEPESVHVAVENADGRPVAELHTGITPTDEDCAPDDASPYTVILSQPVDLPSTAESDQSIEPRLVVRLIEGYRFFSSFGVTDVLGGVDGVACTLYNTVQGPEHVGLYSFGDAISLTALTPEQVGSRTASFETIADAEEFFDAEQFTQIRRMIASLEVAE